MKLKLALIFLVSIFNFWFWRILQYNPILGLLSIAISILLFVSLLYGMNRRNFLILFFLTILEIGLLHADINLKLENPKPEEILQRHEREFYFTQDLGKIFLNRISLNYYQNYDLYITKLQRNFFFLLDPNIYFFGGHPRERGQYEFEKYTFLEIPFFIIGFIFLLRKRDYKIYFYIALSILISLFIDPAFRLGSIFIFPLINVLIAAGFIKIFKKSET